MYTLQKDIYAEDGTKEEHIKQLMKKMEVEKYFKNMMNE